MIPEKLKWQTSNMKMNSKYDMPGTKNEVARKSIGNSRPISPDFHLFESNGYNLLIPDGTRIYEISHDLQEEFKGLIMKEDKLLIGQFLAEHGLQSLGTINDLPIEEPPLTAISLAVAQKCNLGCTYCYARQGDFGAKARNMALQTALDAVDFLFNNNSKSNRVNIAFLGGEPLINRPVLQEVTRYAHDKAKGSGKEVGFSITTNGTLLKAEDADFFEEYGFAVTVSLDGIGETHDRLRPYKGGKGSYERIRANVLPLLAKQNKMQVSARVTVTPLNLNLKHVLDELVSLKFHSVGFSPMLSSPTGEAEMNGSALEEMLENMISCGQEFERKLIAGERYPFSNMSIALQEIHKGSHRPYPCGAGAGYLGVSASGELAACHRFIEDEKGYFGDLYQGIDRERQQAWLTERHVHRQEPCKNCWARYLCGGGCHHEVIHRGRPACDYIRGWLNYVLQAYIRILQVRPDFLLANPSS
jgi:uncharacterized protein